jgi:hypothetical protein
MNELLEKMFNNTNGHTTNCECVHCNSLKVLSFMINEQPEIIEFEEDR